MVKPPATTVAGTAPDAFDAVAHEVVASAPPWAEKSARTSGTGDEACVGEGAGPRVEARRRVDELLWPGDVRDAGGAELDQVLHGRPDTGPVVDADAGGGRVVLARGGDEQGGQPQLLEQGGPRVVDTPVGEEHAVHPSGPGEPAVPLDFGRTVRDHLQDEGLGAAPRCSRSRR